MKATFLTDGHQRSLARQLNGGVWARLTSKTPGDAPRVANKIRTCYDSRVPLRICAVSFADVRGIRHTVEVQAESLFEAAILGVRTFRKDPWIEHVGPATVLDIEVRQPAAKHAITMMQVERWLERASTSPNEGVKKAKLKDLLVSG